MTGIKCGMKLAGLAATASLLTVAGCGSVPGVDSSSDVSQTEAESSDATTPVTNIDRAAELTNEFILPNAAENSKIIERAAAVMLAECLSTDDQEVTIDEEKFQAAYHPEFHTPGQYFTEMKPMGFAKYAENPDALDGYKRSPDEGNYNADVFNVDVGKIMMDHILDTPGDETVGKAGVPLGKCMAHVMGKLTGSEGETEMAIMGAFTQFEDVGAPEQKALQAESVAESLQKYQECVGGKFEDPTGIPKALDNLSWKVARGEGKPQDIADAETEYLALDKKCKTETGFADTWATEYISVVETMLKDHKDQVDGLIKFQEGMLEIAKQNQG